MDCFSLLVVECWHAAKLTKSYCELRTVFFAFRSVVRVAVSVLLLINLLLLAEYLFIVPVRICIFILIVLQIFQRIRQDRCDPAELL